MKICPKCKIQHNKNGNFCTRKCANSRTWSKVDKLKKSISAKNSNKVQLENKSRDKGFITKECINCHKVFSIRKSKSHKKTCSKKCFVELLSLKSKNNPNCGGYRKGSGRSKHGYYKGIYFDSTYELAFYLFKNDPNLKKNTTRIPFKKTYYIPDFKYNDIYFEIKGYHTPIVDEKIQAANAQGIKVVLVGSKEMKPIVKEIKNKFNINSIEELYEKN